MKKIIRLNESDLQRIVNRVIRETTNTKRGRRLYEGLEGDETVTLGDITSNEGMTGKWEVSNNTLYVTLNDKAERSIDSMGNPASSITNNNNEERYGTTDMFWNVVCSTEDVRKGTLRDFPSYEERLHMNGISDPNLDESRRIRNKRRLYETELDRERYSLGDIRASFNGQSGNYVVKHSTLLLTENSNRNEELHVFCDEVDEQSYR
jgi:hypothetical protein